LFATSAFDELEASRLVAFHRVFPVNVSLALIAALYDRFFHFREGIEDAVIRWSALTVTSFAATALEHFFEHSVLKFGNR
jgi:hypothetical protein